MNSIIITLTISSFLLCGVYAANKCYYCLPNPESNDDCSSPIERTCKFSETDTKTYICQTLVQKTGNKFGISKLCVDDTQENIDSCKAKDNGKTSTCKTCKDDLCNKDAAEIPSSGVKVSISAFLMAVSLFLLIG